MLYIVKFKWLIHYIHFSFIDSISNRTNAFQYECYIIQVTEWPWVKFYSKKSPTNKACTWWIENEQQYIISNDEVIKKLLPPTIQMKGRRK